jgi:hypothetical protein
VLRILLSITCYLTWLGCDKNEDLQFNPNGTAYPKGIAVIDFDSTNDCTLPKCDPLRRARISLSNVRALVDSESELSVTLTFDSIIKFEVCNDTLSAFDPGDWVLVSGIARDGCGYFITNYPIEEHYFLHFSSIESL